jgi:hypothetical protein
MFFNVIINPSFNIIVASCCSLPFITVLCATIHEPKNLKFSSLKFKIQH